MNSQETFKTLMHFLNKCVTDEQIKTVVDMGRDFLKDRHHEEDLFNQLWLAAEIKKNLPATKLAWDEGTK